MRTHYFTYGGQPIHFASRWSGYPSVLTRNAAETRGLSDLGFFGSLSDNEKRLATIAGVGLLAFFLFGRKRFVKNPGKRSQYKRGFEGSSWWRVVVEKDRDGRVDHSISVKANTAASAKKKAIAMGWPVYEVEQDD